jgi:LmbE family N-acetylglucosaminyl deacetylase
MSEDRLKLLIIGAHPDDCEYHAGGLATIYAAAGHSVKMVSVTNGEAGHQSRSAAELISIRRNEAHAAAGVIGAESAVWEHPDGRLQPTIPLREQVIRAIRSYEPDLVLTHRTNDYHPDHRAVGQVVQDASYLVTVPLICPDVPHLRRDPVVAYLPDLFTKPAPLTPDVAIDIGPHLETIVRMLAAHHSQFFEWLPYNERKLAEVPHGHEARRAWLADWYAAKLRPRIERCRSRLIATYGMERGSEIEYCEMFEISEYAAPLDVAAREKLFWFLPTSPGKAVP